MKYFVKGNYAVDFLEKETWEEWTKATGIKLSFSRWRELWKALRIEFVKEVAANTAGVDLPFFLGNVSIKVLDAEFKGPKDMMWSNTRPFPGEPFQKKNILAFDTPKKIKYTWTKHPQFRSLAQNLGFEPGRSFRGEIKQYKKEAHWYEKMPKYLAKKSKHEDPKPYSPFGD